VEIRFQPPHLSMVVSTRFAVGTVNFPGDRKMTNEKGAGAPLSAVSVAKKYRIALEDAKTIVAEHGDDAKAIHKAARRIAA